MSAVLVVDSRVNPNDPNQRVELWGNGTINSYNCPKVTDGPDDWFDRLDLPVAVAIHILDWATMAGYVLDKNGGVRRFNGAPDIATSKPDWWDGPNIIVPGIPYWTTGIYKDWSWNPFEPGRGVALDGYGTLHNFGGAPQAPRGLNRWNQPTIARKLLMNWVTLKAYTLDYSGGIHPDYNASPAPGSTRALQPELRQPGDFPYWLRQDTARDFAITDWDGTPAGYTLDKYGAVHAWGGAEAAFGGPYNTGGDWARKLHILNPDNPLRFQVIGSWAQQHIWEASTPPTVVAGGLGPSPANDVYNTTRPSLNWSYSDAQQDSQAEVHVLVFKQSYVDSHTMTDPASHAAGAVLDVKTTDPDTRGIVPSIDFENGMYRMYVRARDTADQYSTWSYRDWTQDVPVPAAPANLTATPDHDAAVVNLSVNVATGGPADLIRFEYSDDYLRVGAAKATWWPVRGAGAVPLTSTTQGADRDVPQGVERAYSAIAYSRDPRTASLRSAIVTANIQLREHLLTSTKDPALGGVVRVVEAPDWARPVSVGVFEPLYPPGGTDVQYPTTISNGAPQSRRIKLTIEANGRDEWDKLEALLISNSTLVHRDPFGAVIYCRLTGWSRKQRLVAPLPHEDTPWRHNHLVDVQLVEVRPPNRTS